MDDIDEDINSDTILSTGNNLDIDEEEIGDRNKP